jgi:uncharacterized protein (DUF924 family)
MAQGAEVAEAEGSAANMAGRDPHGGDPRPGMVLDYWIDEVGPEGWYGEDAARDAEIRARFEAMWEHAMEGALSLWLTYPTGTLAYIVLTDQFSRNMWRGTGRAFASDRAALAAAKAALSRDWDLRIAEPARQFFYLPLMHAESLPDQQRSVRLIQMRLPETGASNLLHAKAHREVIRRFGRFPHRNEALGRGTTLAEGAFLEGGGYGGVVREMEGA